MVAGGNCPRRMDDIKRSTHTPIRQKGFYNTLTLVMVTARSSPSPPLGETWVRGCTGCVMVKSELRYNAVQVRRPEPSK
jgi:hypothetical protein